MRNPLLFFVAAACLLRAADTGSTLLPRRLEKLQRQDFQQLFARSFDKLPGAHQIYHDRGNGFDAVCSIPLLEAKVKNSEKMPHLSTGVPYDGSIAIPSPAPPCKDWNERW